MKETRNIGSSIRMKATLSDSCQPRDEASSAYSKTSETPSRSSEGGSEMFRVAAASGVSSFNHKNIAHKPTSSISSHASQVYEELNRLKFSKLGLYGRENELKILKEYFDKLGESCDNLNLVLVTGAPGTGKTALVKEFTSRMSKHKAVTMATGKYDQHLSIPYGAFVSALSQLCQDIQSHPLYESKIRNAILDAVGNDHKLLLDLIPNLGELIFEADNQTNVADPKEAGPQEYDMVKSKEKFRFLFQRFLHAVCQPEHKIVMVLDDIQWIDEASLNLLESVLADSVLGNSMLVLCVYQDDVVNDDHVVSKLFGKIQGRRGKAPSILVVNNLSQETVTSYISELLNLDRVETLSTIAYQRVDGNMYCLIEFLTLIRDKGILRYDITGMKWVWIEDDIRRSTVVSNNVLSVLMEKVGKLPDDAKFILQVLACLGATFEEDIVTLVDVNLELLEDTWRQSNKRAPNEILQSLEKEGFLEQVHDYVNNSKVYCFSHSQVGLIALDMSNDLSKLQFHIGRTLWESQSDINCQVMLFQIVDLWNDGKEHVRGSKQTRVLIDLSFQAGKKALESCAYGASIIYLQQAIDLIPADKRWINEYDLTLQIYNCLIKAEFSNGTWDLVRIHAKEVISQKDRPILDKIVAYTADVSILSIQEHNHAKAIELAINVLDQLGTSFWLHGGKLSVVGGLLKTKKLLGKIPLESVLTKTEMNDRQKLVSLDMIATVTSSMYACNPDLLMCSVLKTLRWSLKYGISKDTAKCVSFYGVVEMALGNVEYGTKACKLAIELAEKQNLMDTEYSPTAVCYGFVLPWTTPLQTCSNKLLTGYNVGLETGDLHFGFMNITLFCYFSYCCGKPFGGLEADVREYARQMRDYRQLLQLQFLSLTWQMILNLMGRCEGNPVVLSGEVMKYQEVLNAADCDKNPPLRAQVQCFRLELAVYFHDFNLAAKLIGPASVISAVNPGNLIICRNTMFEGIAAFELYRRGRKKWKSTAIKALSRTQKWVDAGNVNCIHILHLLEAEKAAMDQKYEEARELFDKAIVTAARHGFRTDRALATERCAAMYQSRCDDFWFHDYYDKAMESYREIAAYGKVDHMIRRTEKQTEVTGESFSEIPLMDHQQSMPVPGNRALSDLTGIRFPM